MVRSGFFAWAFRVFARSKPVSHACSSEGLQLIRRHDACHPPGSSKPPLGRSAQWFVSQGNESIYAHHPEGWIAGSECPLHRRRSGRRRLDRNRTWPVTLAGQTLSKLLEERWSIRRLDCRALL